MAVRKVLLLVVVACILDSVVPQSFSAVPSPSPITAEPPTHSPSASPSSSALAPAKSNPTDLSPSPAIVNSPPLRPTLAASPSPSDALSPSPNVAPQPSANGAAVNRLGLPAAAAGLFVVAFMA